MVGLVGIYVDGESGEVSHAPLPFSFQGDSRAKNEWRGKKRHHDTRRNVVSRASASVTDSVGGCIFVMGDAVATLSSLNGPFFLKTWGGSRNLMGLQSLEEEL